jgi:hypothetical protein
LNPHTTILLPADEIQGGKAGIASANGPSIALNRTPGKPLSCAFVMVVWTEGIRF